MLKCLGVDNVASFDFVANPSEAALALALEELYALGAIDSEARVVDPFGLRMAHSPLPPMLTRLLLLASEPQFACGEEAAVVCAMLSVQSPWVPTASKDRLVTCRQSFA